MLFLPTAILDFVITSLLNATQQQLVVVDYDSLITLIDNLIAADNCNYKIKTCVGGLVEEGGWLLILVVRFGRLGLLWSFKDVFVGLCTFLWSQDD